MDKDLEKFLETMWKFFLGGLVNLSGWKDNLLVAQGIEIRYFGAIQNELTTKSRVILYLIDEYTQSLTNLGLFWAYKRVHNFNMNSTV
jgi:hypothetical protein